MTTQDPPPNGIDISRPNVARIYDYLLGGKDNFTVDREAAKQLQAVLLHCEGNRAAAAHLLGLHRATLRQKMRRHGLSE